MRGGGTVISWYMLQLLSCFFCQHCFVYKENEQLKFIGSVGW